MALCSTLHWLLRCRSRRCCGAVSSPVCHHEGTPLEWMVVWAGAPSTAISPASWLFLPPPAPLAPHRSYPEGGLTSGESLLNAVGDTCERLDAEYTIKYSKQDAQESSDGGEASTPAPTPTTPASAALGRAPAGVLGALAAAAAALLF